MITSRDLVCKEGAVNAYSAFILKAVGEHLFMPSVNPDPENKVAMKVLPEDLVSFRGMLIPKGVWGPRPRTRRELMLDGVEFNGVVCSLTAEDMWGLAAIKPYVTAGLSFNYHFENGNKLFLTPANMNAFEAVWLPARAAFFPVV